MRCTVLTLTPCAAAITRTPGRSFLREIGQERACQSGQKNCCSPWDTLIDGGRCGHADWRVGF